MSYRSRLIIFFAALMLPLPAAFSIELGSRNCAQIFDQRRSILNLPPKAHLLVIAMLAETTRGERYLALSDYYWGSHEEIYRKVSEKYPLKRILWAGEMLVENSENRSGPGVVVFSINTSGFLARRIIEGHNDANDPEVLKANLATHNPSLTTPYSQYFTYDRSNVHLDPLFRELHSRVQPHAPDDTVRRRFRDVLTSVYLLYREIAVSYSTSYPAANLAMVRRMSSSMINDIVSVIASEAHHSILPQQGRTSESLIKEKEYFYKILELIKKIGPRANPGAVDIEIIRLSSSH